MARGILSKFISGAAEAGVPMLQEQHRANIQARRDEALNRIQQQYRKEDQALRTAERAEDRSYEVQDQKTEIEAQQTRDAMALSERAGTRVQDQANKDREFEADTSKQTVTWRKEYSDTGEVIGESPFVFNPQSGELTPVKVSGTTGTASPPQGAIDALLAEPTPERVEAFNQKYGDQLASKYLDQNREPEVAPTPPPASRPPSGAAALTPSASAETTTQSLDAAATTQEPGTLANDFSSYEVAPSLTQRLGQYIDNQAAGNLSAESMIIRKPDVDQARARDAEWFKSYLDKGQLPGAGPSNTARIKSAVESGLLNLTPEQIGEIYGYLGIK